MSHSRVYARAIMPIGYEIGSVHRGFRVKRTAEVELMRSLAVELEHEASGARVLHVKNDDSENLFSITFPTVPPDDTGVPHILEHSVLAGSRRYPHKDSFMELYRSSAATFINAMTAGDHTLYPVSSTVPRDLFILADVYFDAVFHPLLSEHTFRREGHRLELVTKGDGKRELSIKGIVYSEMRGAYSDAESLLHRERDRALFPDTLYGRDSGGDPAVIPELDYQSFRAFYQRYYHPSNALFVLYGNIPTEDYLEFLEQRLNGFQRRACDIAFPRQPRWQSPRTLRITYPESKSRAGDAYLLLTWLAGDGMNPTDVLGLYLLHCLLLGHEGAPLRKAILDAKLGEDLALSGASAHSLEAKFAIGIKGSQAERAEAFVSLVESTLRSFVETGFERAAIESAAQQLAYSTLEIGSSFPIQLLWRLSTRYVLTGDFVEALRPAQHLARVRQHALDEPTFLTQLLKERLIDNPHRLLMVAEGDPEYTKKRDQALAEALRAKQDALSESETQKLLSDADAFEKQENQTPDRSAFEKLPFLKTGDLPRKPRQIPRTLQKEGRLEFIQTDVFSNGVNYLCVAFDLSHVPTETLPFIELYVNLLAKLGTSRRDYVQTGELMAAHTGGIWGWLGVSAHITDRERVVRQLYLTTKFLDGHAEQALSLMEELLFELDVGRVERVAEGLIQARAAQRSSLAWMAPHFTSLQGARGVSPEGWLSNQLGGVPRLGRIERLAKGFETRDAKIVDELSSELKIVSELLRRSPHLSACFTGSTAERETSRSRLKQWTSEAPATDLAPIPWAPRERIERVGLAAPMDVAFCAFVLPGLHPADAQSEAVSAGAQHLSLHWVLDEIRLKGAAYGAGCALDLFHRALQFSSYDDPNPARTLGVFESASARLRELEWTQAGLDRTLITLAKDSLEPNRPGEATNMALSWHVLGVNDDLRTERYQALLGVSAPQAKAALVDMLERGADRACACVAGDRAELERVNLALGERALSIEELIP